MIYFINYLFYPWNIITQLQSFYLNHLSHCVALPIYTVQLTVEPTVQQTFVSRHHRNRRKF